MARIDRSLLLVIVSFAAAGCIVRTPRPQVVVEGRVGGAPPPPAPAEPPPAYVASGGPIEAGCSFNATQIQQEMGATVEIACPANCKDTGATWGTDVYSADSAICRAAVHAGATGPGGGVVTVQLEPGRPAYRGTVRNGVESYDYGQYGSSYRFVGVAPQAAAPTVAAPSLIEAGCSYNAGQIRGEVGTSHRVACPPGCAGSGATWGTDIYTGDSAICRAAVHAGLISDQSGGQVTVVLEPGRPAYRGSTRNGVQSHDYGQYGKSYRLSR